MKIGQEHLELMRRWVWILLPLFFAPLLHPMMTPLTSLPSVASSSEDTGDLWLHVNLTAFSADQSFQWDADATEIDPTLNLCVEVESENFQRCSFIFQLENTSTIQEQYHVDFDLPDSTTNLTLQFICLDDDSYIDEWDNGDDPCDISPKGNITQVMVEMRATDITTNVSSSGFEDDWDQAGAAMFNASAHLVAYGDGDNDGVSDILDACSDTPNEAEVGTEGCAWSQLDWDGDALLNGVDPCPSLIENSCQSHNGFIKYGTFEFGGEYYEKISRFHRRAMACLPTT